MKKSTSMQILVETALYKNINTLSETSTVYVIERPVANLPDRIYLEEYHGDAIMAARLLIARRVNRVPEFKPEELVVFSFTGERIENFSWDFEREEVCE